MICLINRVLLYSYLNKCAKLLKLCHNKGFILICLIDIGEASMSTSLIMAIHDQADSLTGFRDKLI